MTVSDATRHSNFAEGNGVDSNGFITLAPPTFTRMIVLDVISDPNNVIDDKKIAYWAGVLHVSNIKYANSLPRNSIIARRIKDNSHPMFVLPFFPSHIAMPCKAGECIWVMFEKPSAQNSDIAYWFCRTTDLQHVDDVNHSHTPRLHESSAYPGIIERATSKQPIYELRNGPIEINNGERTTVQSHAYLKGGDENIFETLIEKTDASNLTNFESVPRYRKRPGDIVFEGSNNSLIVLGTDRVGPIASYLPDKDELRGTIPNTPLGDFTKSAGSVDIVTGRGQTASTSGKEVITTSITDAKKSSPGREIKRELGKSKSELISTEGDPDLINDRSRILVSQRTSVDTNFGLSGYNADITTAGGSITDSTAGDAAIVLKTDKIRIIARSDIEILVTGFSTNNEPGKQDIKNESNDTKTYASIIIKTNGDIIFKPSEAGYVKLGDDTADRAVLCSDLPASLDEGKVSPATAALTNTMGGKFGGTQIPTQGTWAKKVLVTGAR